MIDTMQKKAISTSRRCLQLFFTCVLLLVIAGSARATHTATAGNDFVSITVEANNPITIALSGNDFYIGTEANSVEVTVTAEIDQTLVKPAPPTVIIPAGGSEDYETDPVQNETFEGEGTIYFPKVEFEDSTTENYSPQLGEIATLNVKLKPSPPGGGFPDLYFELEIVRELKGGGQQHIQWIDVDPTKPYVDLTRQADFTSLSLTWVGIPDVQLDGNSAKAYGPEVFTGVSGSFNRTLPAVTAGETVPPPSYHAVGRLRRTSAQSTLCEAKRRIHVKQIVKVDFTSAAEALMASEIVQDDTTLIDQMSAIELSTLKDAIVYDMYNKYGAQANIEFGQFVGVQQPFSTLIFKEEDMQGSALGRAYHTDFANADANKNAKVFVRQTRNTIAAEFIINPQLVVPVTLGELRTYFGNIASHEVGHLLGLVAQNSVLDGTSGTHNKSPYSALNIMDPGGYAGHSIDDDLGRNEAWSFRSRNQSYIEFVLPTP